MWQVFHNFHSPYCGCWLLINSISLLRRGGSRGKRQGAALAIDRAISHHGGLAGILSPNLLSSLFAPP